jgi:flagellar basal-body rod modification protein FlgD
VAVDGVTGAKNTTDASTTASKTLESDGMGRDAFLQLLVTKLKNQDPTNPATDTEFLGQLAQFSSLEQLTSINAAVTSLAARMDSLEAMRTSTTTPPNERKA